MSAPEINKRGICIIVVNTKYLGKKHLKPQPAGTQNTDMPIGYKSRKKILLTN